jgi:hypothetical protein
LPALSDWLIERHGDTADGLFCEPGVTC